MLDTSRNWFSVTDIKRTLTAMGWAKLNMVSLLTHAQSLWTKQLTAVLPSKFHWCASACARVPAKC